MSHPEHPEMPVPTSSQPSIEWATAEDAYHIINHLLTYVHATSDLIALMATALGEAQVKNLAETHPWVDYLAARRMLEQIQPEIQKFSQTMIELARDRPDRPDPEEE